MCPFLINFNIIALETKVSFCFTSRHPQVLLAKPSSKECNCSCIMFISERGSGEKKGKACLDQSFGPKNHMQDQLWSTCEKDLSHGF